MELDAAYLNQRSIHRVFIFEQTGLATPRSTVFFVGFCLLDKYRGLLFRLLDIPCDDSSYFCGPMR
jgi:hypothetical protein